MTFCEYAGVCTQAQTSFPARPYFVFMKLMISLVTAKFYYEYSVYYLFQKEKEILFLSQLGEMENQSLTSSQNQHLQIEKQNMTKKKKNISRILIMVEDRKLITNLTLNLELNLTFWHIALQNSGLAESKQLHFDNVSTETKIIIMNFSPRNSKVVNQLWDLEKNSLTYLYFSFRICKMEISIIPPHD